MTPQEFSDWIYYHSLMAAMSQDYYKILGTALWVADLVMKFMTLVLAAFAIGMEIRARSACGLAVPASGRRSYSGSLVECSQSKRRCQFRPPLEQMR